MSEKRINKRDRGYRFYRPEKKKVFISVFEVSSGQNTSSRSQVGIVK
jgi:hypothetical protein